MKGDKGDPQNGSLTSGIRHCGRKLKDCGLSRGTVSSLKWWLTHEDVCEQLYDRLWRVLRVEYGIHLSIYPSSLELWYCHRSVVPITYAGMNVQTDSSVHLFLRWSVISVIFLNSLLNMFSLYKYSPAPLMSHQILLNVTIVSCVLVIVVPLSSWRTFTVNHIRWNK